MEEPYLGRSNSKNPLSRSLIAYFICVALLVSGGLIYYPKWKLSRTEATISWDVSGYYYYLPAFLIYHDVKELKWHDDILNRYYPAPGDQAYRHTSGHMVMKYSAGLALQYLPFFLIAHAIAPHTSFAADGFSLPYQLAITLGSLFFACLGLWFLRKILRAHFSDGIVALVLLVVTAATNYLDYAAINHAMTHNYLFTWYAILIFLSAKYWKKPSLGVALGIGGITGLMALTRPSEAVAILLPILWGVDSWPAMRERMQGFWKYRGHMIVAMAAFLLMGLIQAAYWKYVTGEWIVYSYQDQGFSWLSPHFMNGLFSYRAGWLVYSPVMILALIGFFFLWKKDRKLFVPILLMTMVFMYITWAWDIWWYGGSLGQRAMVQLYPVLAFPLAACLERIYASGKFRVVVSVFLILCVYYNLWLTHQAHRGGLLRAGDMTKAYFWKILGKYHAEEEAQFLLDNGDLYRGMATGKQVLHEDFESMDSTAGCPLEPIHGKSFCLGPETEFMPMLSFKIPDSAKWLRATATFRCAGKEWDTWKMAQFRLHALSGTETVKTNVIRVYRALSDGETQQFSVDLRIPGNKEVDMGAVDVWNAGSQKYLTIDDISVIYF